MEDGQASPPPSECCSASNDVSDDQKQACCDNDCLTVAAHLECDAQCKDGEAVDEDLQNFSDFTETVCQTHAVGPSKGPCDKHRKAAYEGYATVLESAGCICKALTKRNLESCCSSIRKRTKPSSAPATLRARTSSSNLRSSRSTGCSIDAGNSVIDCWGKANSCGSKTNASGKRPASRMDIKNCCREKNTPSMEASASSRSAQGACLQKSCCHKESDASSSDQERGECGTKTITTPARGSRYVEEGTTIIEHVTLGVEGLTCVGCENKLFRSLDAIRGVHNLQTSLILSQADFDIDADARTVNEIIREVTRATGFTCQRVNTQGRNLEILVPGDARKFISQKRAHGVEGLVALDKRTVRVTYDAKLVGVRDLLDNTFGSTTTLAPLRPYAEFESGVKQVRKTFYTTAFSALLTIPVLVLAWAPLPQHDVLYGAISLALATLVQVVVAGPFYPSALRALLFTQVIEMDLLIVLSTSAAYVFSVIAFAHQVRGHPLSTGQFFETSTLLVTLIMVGRLVSAFARHKSVESISIRSLQIDTAILVNGDGRYGQEIDARLLQYGDIFKVMPDSRIPTDGIVISGQSEVDESHITGEAVPVNKMQGSNIIAGCLNGSGALVVRLTRLPGENTISEIASMVDAAKFSKPKIQHLADRVASYFVPVVVALTLITFVIWVVIGTTIQDQSKGSAAVQAMTYAIAVLIVSCPCAIGLAVPMVVVIAGGLGAKHGVVFKSAETIEIARKVSHVVFDKTGTLTKGELSVSAEEYLSGSDSSVASLALGLTINSKHPVSAAVAAHLHARAVQPALVKDVKSITGKGIEGVWNGTIVRGGNSRWLAVQTRPQVTSLLSQGRTVFCVSLGDELLAVYGLNDSLRADAISVVSELQHRDIAVSIVSGDDDGAVQKIGNQLGIPGAHVRSRCSPEGKQQYIHAIMAQRGQTVLFCGDGTNDAVALAQATIGLHMSSSSGTDVAQSAADAVLVRPALAGVLVLMDLSRAAFRRIVFNFAWCFTYNTLAVLLAAGAFVRARIPPQYAGLGELVSVLPVILIALQLKAFKRR